MSIIAEFFTNVFRLMTGRHKSLIMDVAEVDRRINALTVARHYHCNMVAMGDDNKYRRAHDEWMLSDRGSELVALQFWRKHAR